MHFRHMEKERIWGEKHLSFFDLMPYHHMAYFLGWRKNSENFVYMSVNVCGGGVLCFFFNFMSYHRTIPLWTSWHKFIY